MCESCKQLDAVVASSNAQANVIKAMRQARVLQIKLKSVYGNTLIYPANEAAELIAKIAGTKTLSNEQLAYAELLGFQIQEVPAYQLKVAA